MRAERSPLRVGGFVGFAAFGAFWGVWGASLPRIRTQAGLDDAQLGTALLFVGAGALPAMLLTGRALDRWGLRIAAPTIAALGAAGVLTALSGRSLLTLSVALTVVGVTSGAADVAINSVAGRAERDGGRPALTRAHATFSTFVVLGSAGTGLLIVFDAPVVAPFALVAVLSVLATAAMHRSLRSEAGGRTRGGGPVGEGEPPGALGSSTPPDPHQLAVLSLLGLGGMGSLALASENAHQSWSAIYLTDVLGTDVAVAALAPALFATVVALTRFAAGGLGAAHARVVLAVGSATAAVGAVLVAVAPNLEIGAVGLIVAAAGTAILFPALLGVVSARVDEAARGRATSLVTSVSYLGFLFGPVYVGYWAGSAGLRHAMLAVAALGAVLLLLAPLVESRPASRSTVDRRRVRP